MRKRYILAGLERVRRTIDFWSRSSRTLAGISMGPISRKLVPLKDILLNTLVSTQASRSLVSTVMPSRSERIGISERSFAEILRSCNFAYLRIFCSPSWSSEILLEVTPRSVLNFSHAWGAVLKALYIFCMVEKEAVLLRRSWGCV